MKKYFLLIIMLFFVTGCGNNKEENLSKINTNNSDNIADMGIIADDIPITRGEVARIIALSFYTNDEILSLDEVYNFKDIENSTYKDYINACVNLGYIQNTDEYRPEDNLTISEAQAITNNIDEDDSIVLNFEENDKLKSISYALFVKTFMKVLDENELLDKNNINRKNVIVLATKENNNKLGNNIITDYGAMKVSYIDYSEQLNSQISTLVRDDEIICAIEIINNSPKLEDVYILKSEKNILSVFVGGLTRQYKSEDNFDKDLSGYLCDLKIEGNNIIELDIHENFVREEVKLIDIDSGEQKLVELENDKVLKFADYYQLKVFKDYGGKVRSGEFSDVVIGDDNTSFFLNDNDEIIGCVINEEPQKDNIRVLINTTNFSSKYHESVSITSDSEFYVKNGEFEKTIAKNDTYIVPENNANRVIVTPEKNGELILKNVNRHSGIASYEGTLEIINTENGFLVVNSLPVETYLQRVVPSEMPSSYHIEALKAQAVTARSFAVKTLTQSSYKKYGANLDDSTSSQVYNNVTENDRVNSAISSTAGEFLTYDGLPISTNFYSTSSGYGANSGEVWADFKNSTFPTYTPTYLTSKPLVSKSDRISFEDEDDISKFLKSDDINAVDSNYPWFRWNYKMSAKELEATINKNIATRYKVNPFMILTKVGDEYVQQEVGDIGEIKDINILGRGSGGIITAIEVVGSNETIKIKGEYNIRYILKPTQYTGGEAIKINKNDGSVSENYSLIPSAFFVIEKSFDEFNNLESIEVFGGGNGHGVGMSQNGAEELAKNDIDYESILKYFYTDVELTKN